MGTSGWSTQQLAEFVAAVSAAENEASAATTAVERAAEALDADVAAIVCTGQLIAAIGYPGGTAPIGELEAVNPGIEGSALDIPGVGAASAAAAPLEHPPGSRLVIARGGPTGLTREETGLLRGMARVASMTMRMLRVLDNERAARGEVERLALDQAALRRVATLVAKAAPREDVYAAVAAEIAQRLGADVVALLRYEANGTATIIGGWGVPGQEIPIGAQLRVAGEGVAVSVLHTRRPARVERFDGPPGSVAACFRSLGVHTGVGCPIMVDDDLWGVAFAATARRDALPAGSEARIAEFTQLVAAAIANAEARGEVRRIAEEQAALRRVATLVARGAAADEILRAVASETRAVLDSDISTLLRLEPDGMITVMATDSTLSPVVAVGERHKPLPGGAVERALKTGQTARTDGYEGEPGSMGDHLRALGYGGSASAPIVVADRLWGVISVVWAQGRSVLPGSEDRLMQFGELIATALANAEARADLRQVAEEQAALRRVATRVARGEPPSAVFAAVAVEAGHVIPAADVALVGRYDPDDAIELVGGWSRDGDPSFVGDRVALGGHNVSTLVFQTNHPARRDHIPDDSTPASALARKWARSSAGAPINVEGRLWGVIIVGGADEDALPAGTEDRLGQFSELVATAIGNAEAREELRRVADEQAALRRVATVVARDEAPEAAFAAVAEELGHLFGAEATGVNRYEIDGTVTTVGSWNSLGEPIAGTRTTLGGRNVTTLVFETEQPARIDRYDANDSSRATSIARRHGARSAAGAPIRVAGRLWGSVQVAMSREAALPPRTEERLAAFAELTASAIAKAQAREELRAIADEQAALRRVATLVAEAAAPSAVFASVAEEVCRLLIAERAYVGRFEEDGTVTVIAGWNATGEEAPGFPVKLSGDEGLSARVRETGRPGRVDRYDEPVRQRMLDRGIRSAVAAPITVERRIWGTVGATSASDDPAPPSAEERLSRFSELVGTAIANAQAREELRRAADDQAALRRVATLVARAAPPAEVFAAVAAEIGRLLSVEGAGVLRYDGDRSATVVGGWSGTADPARIGLTIPLGGHNAVTRVFKTGRPARIEYAADDSNAATAQGREAGGRAAIGAPIGVAGRLWGALVLVTGGEDTLTAETETRLVAFAELVATAIANAEARGELRRVADEQAALRRVATLVARGAPPAEVFSAVAEEVGRLLHADNALVVGFDDDATATVVALSGAPQVAHVGLRQRFSESRMSRLVHESGHAVRIDDYAALTGGAGDDMVRSGVGAPITVGGRLWGMIAVSSRRAGSLGPDTEARLTAFTELAATAIANAQAQADLAASRARVVASADETRRRIERDLHDGAQAQLVTLVLQVRAAQEVLPPDDLLAAELDRVATGLTSALDELRELASGIHPPILASGGLGPAVRMLGRRARIPVDVDVRTDGRLPEPVEVGAYYVVSEALTNAVKHSEATFVTVQIEADNNVLRICVQDDGVGGAEFARGSGLLGLRDRVEALGGRIALESERGAGTSLSVELPLRPDRAAVAR